TWTVTRVKGSRHGNWAPQSAHPPRRQNRPRSTRNASAGTASRTRSRPTSSLKPARAACRSPKATASAVRKSRAATADRTKGDMGTATVEAPARSLSFQAGFRRVASNSITTSTTPTNSREKLKMEGHGVIWLLVGIAIVAVLAVFDVVRRRLQERRDRQAPEVEKYVGR